MVSIRALVPDDLDIVTRHREEMFRTSRGDIPQLAQMREPFRNWVKPRLDDGRYFGWLAEEAGRVIGGMGMMVIDWPPHPMHPEDCRRGYILNVYVEPDCRKRGVATALMKAAEDEARRRDLAFAILHPTRQARSIYERLGWQDAAAWGIELDVAEPQSVGADRVLNAIAAHAGHPADLIVIDFGTATTFDVVDYSGAYKGGIIAPGINLSLDALVAAAAKLPRIAIAAPDGTSVVGRTTESQMGIGIFWGYVAMIEGLVARLKAEIGRPVKVISTGGLAILFNDHISVFDTIEPDLTIQGLGLLYERSLRAS